MAKKTGAVLSIVFLLILSFAISDAFGATQKEMEDFWGNTFGWEVPQEIKNLKGVTPVKRSVSALSRTTNASDIAPGPWATSSWSLLAKAPADECYYGIGDPNNGPASAVNLPNCANNGVGQPKVNQAYVWGLVKNGLNLWFGTIANTHCLVMGGFLGATGSHDNLSWVCEFGDSVLSPPLPSAIGDFRPPMIYTFNTSNNTLTDKTPLVTGAGAPHSTRLNSTIGLRSAGAIGDLVILAGPSWLGGINLFAFNGSTGAFIDSANLPEFNDIRKWLVVNNVLYTTVGNSGSCGNPAPSGRGSVLRWTGTVASPFTYDIVGNIGSMGAELADHEGRLFVSTWPRCSDMASLYMSPTIPGGGLTAADAGSWTKVWDAFVNYEPDFIVASTYAGGALHSYDGYLYWGTMHVPFLATAVAIDALGTAGLDADGSGSLEPDEMLATALGTYRAINIFRGKDFATTPQLEVLYGLPFLPVYDAGAKSYTIALDPAHMNKMPDPFPKMGLPGFGNFFNVYTWAMETYNDQLYIGTFDWSYLLAQGILGIAFDMIGTVPSPVQAQIIADIYSMLKGVNLPWYVWGADLYRIMSEDGIGVALPEDVAGLGNFTNYGIRNMIHGSGLFLGMANPMNLLTIPSPNDPNNVLPEGGWELISLEATTIAAPTMNEWGMFIFMVLAGLGSACFLRRRIKA